MAVISNKLKNVLKSGTMAGVLVAIFILVLFILVATFLKSLIFGIILAYFFLPLEKFFENRVFQWKWIRFISDVIRFLGKPFSYLKNRCVRSKELSPEEIEEKKRKHLVQRSSVATVLTVILAIVLLLLAVAALLIPGSTYVSRQMDEWLRSNQHIRQAENYIQTYTHQKKKSEQKKSISPLQQKQEQEKSPFGEINSVREVFQWIRSFTRTYAETHRDEVLGIMFSKGKDIFSVFFSIIGFLGGFAFTILLSIVFFFFFLYQMALFMRETSQNKNIGAWCVRGIFSSGWMPRVSAATKNEAAEIINHIVFMLTCWIRGYLWIIIIEVVLYSLAFSLFSVPYAPLLAIPSSMTVLLPFFGLIGNIILAVLVCVLFCEGNLLAALVGVAITYLLVNGVLEQLVLYPSMVGGALGLTVLETIIVVLLGGFLAGIAGMIFAVPAAAVLKYLIPKIYSSFEE